MAFFKKKKIDVIDLTERYNRQRERAQEIIPKSSENDAEGFGFFGAIAQTAAANSEPSSDYVDMAESAEEKKRKLAKRLQDMTARIEDLSNQIYHLQQRIELLERKAGVGGGF